MREAGLQGAFLRRKWRTSSTRQNPAATPAPVQPGFLEQWGPKLAALTPFIAVGLFLLTRQWVFFLLIPVAGMMFGSSRKHDGHHRRRDHG